MPHLSISHAVSTSWTPLGCILSLVHAVLAPHTSLGPTSPSPLLSCRLGPASPPSSPSCAPSWPLIPHPDPPLPPPPPSSSFRFRHPLSPSSPLSVPSQPL